jgi:hypothetical protein
MTKDGKAMGAFARGQHGAKGAGVDAPGERLDEFDLASDIKGKDSLKGPRGNERQEQAGATGETEGLIESFENADPAVRAEKQKGIHHGKSAQ